MHTSISSSNPKIISAINVKLDQDQLLILLDDGREISISLSKFQWLNWLASASPAHKANRTLEPGGFEIYWPDLNDGVKVEHLL